MKKVAALPEFAIRERRRHGRHGKLVHADPAHIAAVVHHELRGTFFTIDLSAARDALQRVSWIRRVAVRRAMAGAASRSRSRSISRSRAGTTSSLVNTQGEVFDAEYGDDLPTFYAPEGTSAEVAARYREFAALLDRGQHAGDAIESITRSARGAWDVKLDDGLRWRSGASRSASAGRAGYRSASATGRRIAQRARAGRDRHALCERLCRARQRRLAARAGGEARGRKPARPNRSLRSQRK